MRYLSIERLCFLMFLEGNFYEGSWGYRFIEVRLHLPFYLRLVSWVLSSPFPRVTNQGVRFTVSSSYALMYLRELSTTNRCTCCRVQNNITEEEEWKKNVRLTRLLLAACFRTSARASSLSLSTPSRFNSSCSSNCQRMRDTGLMSWVQLQYFGSDFEVI